MGKIVARRLLIFGARGFIGGWLRSAAQPVWDAISSDRDGRVDIADADACRRLFDAVRPDTVFLLAAASDIDRCEREPQWAEAVNVRGPEAVARECRRTGVRLLFTSSGAVFDGTASSYSETDAPSPVSVYGRSKAGAENIVTGLLPDAVIVRLSLVLGHAPADGTNALVNRWLAAWEAGKSVAVPADEYRNAIDIGTLVSFLLELAGHDRSKGIYHAGSANALSRFEIARAMAAELGYPTDLVEAQARIPERRAPRGRYEFLRTDKLAAICRTPIPSCEEAIRRCAHATAQSHS